MLIDDVVRRTGLTARALRFYEARGLVKPLRTHGGRRLYNTLDLERLHRIVSLKKAGFTLIQIRLLFEQRSMDLATILKTQQTQLKSQIADASKALKLVESALSRVDRGEPLDAEILCSLISNGEHLMSNQTAWKSVIDQHFSPEAQNEWRTRMGGEPELNQAEYGQKWADLGARIEAALPMAPDCPEALAFAKEWLALLEPFTKNASQDMWNATAQFYEKMEQWQDQWNPGFSKSVWLFIGDVVRAARASGKDVGPLPDFMKA